MSDDPFGTCHDDCEEHTMPSLGTMAKNLVKEVGAAIGAGVRGESVIASDETIQTRLKICEGCPHFTEQRRCTQCGCYMDHKTTLNTAKCPIGKWEAAS